MPKPLSLLTRNTIQTFPLIHETIHPSSTVLGTFPIDIIVSNAEEELQVTHTPCSFSLNKYKYSHYLQSLNCQQHMDGLMFIGHGSNRDTGLWLKCQISLINQLITDKILLH